MVALPTRITRLSRHAGAGRASAGVLRSHTVSLIHGREMCKQYAFGRHPPLPHPPHQLSPYTRARTTQRKKYIERETGKQPHGPRRPQISGLRDREQPIWVRTVPTDNTCSTHATRSPARRNTSRTHHTAPRASALVLGSKAVYVSHTLSVESCHSHPWRACECDALQRVEGSREGDRRGNFRRRRRRPASSGEHSAADARTRIRHHEWIVVKGYHVIARRLDKRFPALCVIMYVRECVAAARAGAQRICFSVRQRGQKHGPYQLHRSSARRSSTGERCAGGGGGCAAMPQGCVRVCAWVVSSRSSATPAQGRLGWSISALC